jgi:hypothetical protein
MRRTGHQLETLEPRLVLSTHRLIPALVLDSISASENRSASETQESSEAPLTPEAQLTSEVQPAGASQAAAETQPAVGSQPVAATQPAAGVQEVAEFRASNQESSAETGRLSSDPVEASFADGAIAVTEIAPATTETQIDSGSPAQPTSDESRTGTLSAVDLSNADESSPSTRIDLSVRPASTTAVTVSDNSTPAPSVVVAVFESERSVVDDSSSVSNEGSGTTDAADAVREPTVTLNTGESAIVGETSPSTGTERPVRQASTTAASVSDSTTPTRSVSVAVVESERNVVDDSNSVSDEGSGSSGATGVVGEPTDTLNSDETSTADDSSPSTATDRPIRQKKATSPTEVTETTSPRAIVVVDSRQDEVADSEPVTNDVVDTTGVDDTPAAVSKRRVIKLASDENLTPVDESGEADDIVEAADRGRTVDQGREVSVDREDEHTAAGDESSGASDGNTEESPVRTDESSGSTDKSPEPEENIRDIDSETGQTEQTNSLTYPIRKDTVEEPDVYSEQYASLPATAFRFSTTDTSEHGEIVLEDDDGGSEEGALSWGSKLAESFLSLFGFGAGLGPEGAHHGGRVSLAMASVLPMFLIGRRRTGESGRSTESLDGSVSSLDRKPWRERRRFAGSSKSESSGSRRSRHRGPILSPDLTTPDISDAFVLSTMNSVDPSAFHLGIMPVDDQSGESTDDDSVGLMAGAIAGTVAAGGGIASKVRNSRTPKRHQKPTVDYTGTTRAF